MTLTYALSLLLTLTYAQDYNCPPYSSTPGNCTTVRKSQKCGNYIQFNWDPVTAAPTIWPTHCADNPDSNRWCMATPVSPSTPTSGLCRPRCVTNIKIYYLGTNFNNGGGCPSLTTNSMCAQSVINCDSFNIKCDWCAWNNSTNTCYKAFYCNNNPF